MLKEPVKNTKITHTFPRRAKNKLSAFLASIEYKNEFWNLYKPLYQDVRSEVKLALKAIAACQILELSLPEPMLKVFMPNNFEELQKFIGKGYISKEPMLSLEGRVNEFSLGEKLARKLLQEYNVRGFEEFSKVYSELIKNILLMQPADSFENTQQMRFIRRILNKMIFSQILSIFEVSGKKMASRLYADKEINPKISSYLVKIEINGDNIEEVKPWATVMKQIGDDSLAEKLLNKIYDYFKEGFKKDSDDDINFQLWLAMGLANFKNSRASSLELFTNLAEKIKNKDTAVLKKVVHKWIDTLGKLGENREALKTIEKYFPNDNLFDIALRTKKAIILGNAGDLILLCYFKSCIFAVIVRQCFSHEREEEPCI